MKREKNVQKKSVKTTSPRASKPRVSKSRQGKVLEDKEKIQELLSRGVSEIIVEKELREAFRSGRRLRVKLGIDPTSPDIHIGRMIPLLKLRDFQELGHQVVLIVGDFTSVIGDTSDKDSERPMLSNDVIEKNKKTYFEQAGKIIDLGKTELRYNSEWLLPLTYREIGIHADQFSIADFIARENIARRIAAGKRVSLREVLYPLMQGYDSVAIESDVELGGTDQKFNLLSGRTLQEHAGQRPQNIIMNPLINGLDGRKMSSSWGNAINITATPEDMYGKVMRMADSEIMTYFTVSTRIPLREVDEISRALERGENPKNAKMRLAREIVSLCHSPLEAAKAEEAFIATFQEGSVPEDIETISNVQNVADALLQKKLVASKSDLHRLLQAGGVRYAETGEKLVSLNVPRGSTLTLKIGKRRFIRIKLKK